MTRLRFKRPGGDSTESDRARGRGACSCTESLVSASSSSSDCKSNRVELEA